MSEIKMFLLICIYIQGVRIEMNCKNSNFYAKINPAPDHPNVVERAGVDYIRKSKATYAICRCCKGIKKIC